MQKRVSRDKAPAAAPPKPASGQSKQDKRRTPRLDIDRTVQALIGGTTIACKLSDVSKSGARLASRLGQNIARRIRTRAERRSPQWCRVVRRSEKHSASSLSRTNIELSATLYGFGVLDTMGMPWVRPSCRSLTNCDTQTRPNGGEWHGGHDHQNSIKYGQRRIRLLSSRCRLRAKKFRRLCSRLRSMASTRTSAIVADEFASHGYIAAAPDLFWRWLPGPIARRRHARRRARRSRGLRGSRPTKPTWRTRSPMCKRCRNSTAALRRWDFATAARSPSSVRNGWVTPPAFRATASRMDMTISTNSPA